MNATAERMVSEFMTRRVLSIHRGAELTDAIRMMGQERVSVLPVVDSTGKICGMLSTSDLISSTYNLQSDISVLPYVSEAVQKTLIDAMSEDCRLQCVSSLMSDHVECVEASATLGQAARLMTQNAIHHLPVVDEAGRPVGILSTTDIVRAVGYSFDLGS